MQALSTWLLHNAAFIFLRCAHAAASAEGGSRGSFIPVLERCLHCQVAAQRVLIIEVFVALAQSGTPAKHLLGGVQYKRRVARIAQQRDNGLQESQSVFGLSQQQSGLVPRRPRLLRQEVAHRDKQRNVVHFNNVVNQLAQSITRVHR